MKLILLLSIFSLNAFAERSFVLKASNQANIAILGVPALPSLHAKDNEVEFSFMGSSFKIESEISKNQAINSGGYVNFFGGGGAFLIHKYLNKNIGVYIRSADNQIKGEATTNFGGNYVEATGVESELFNISIGFSMTAFKNSFLPIQLFAGPSFNYSKFNQTITSGSGDNFEMSANPSAFGYQAGAQIGIYLSDWLAINPYIILGDLIDEKDKCQEFKAEVNSYGNLWDLGDQECIDGQNSSTQSFYYDPSYSIIGVNILIPYWNLGINVYTSAKDIEGLQNAPIKMYSMSLSF